MHRENEVAPIPVRKKVLDLLSMLLLLLQLPACSHKLSLQIVISQRKPLLTNQNLAVQVLRVPDTRVFKVIYMCVLSGQNMNETTFHGMTAMDWLILNKKLDFVEAYI